MLCSDTTSTTSKSGLVLWVADGLVQEAVQATRGGLVMLDYLSWVEAEKEEPGLWKQHLAKPTIVAELPCLSCVVEQAHFFLVLLSGESQFSFSQPQLSSFHSITHWLRGGCCIGANSALCHLCANGIDSHQDCFCAHMAQVTSQGTRSPPHKQAGFYLGRLSSLA